MNQFLDRKAELRWRRAVEVAVRVLFVEGDEPCSAAELVACPFPPRVLEMSARRHLTRVRWFELRRALLRRLVFLGWSSGEIRSVARFDREEIRTARRENSPAQTSLSRESGAHAELPQIPPER